MESPGTPKSLVGKQLTETAHNTPAPSRREGATEYATVGVKEGATEVDKARRGDCAVTAVCEVG